MATVFLARDLEHHRPVALKVMRAELAPAAGPRIARGTPEFRRTTRAMFAAGYATFALVYCVQPLMPELARTFGLDAATSSLSLSVTTGALAAALLVVGGLAESWGRKRLMTASIAVSSLLTLGTAVVPSWHALLALRAVEGVTFAGVPALAMAYLSEEMDAAAVGLAMGLYISGSALGGMSGRLVTAALADFATWRTAVATIGVIGLACAVLFGRSLPPSRHFTPRPLALRPLLRTYAEHVRDPQLAALFGEAFLLMGSFVASYNYISFRLLAPPYSLRQSAIGAIFLVYLVGIGASTWVGSVAGRFGRPTTLRASAAIFLAGVALTLATPLPLVIAGIVVITFGFFGAHSTASSWVGLRAKHARAQASSLYLFCYYVGASVAGWAGGHFWERWRWTGVAAFIGSMVAVALLTALALGRPSRARAAGSA